MAGEHRERPNLGQGPGYLCGDVQLEQLCYASSNCAWRTLCGKARWWRQFCRDRGLVVGVQFFSHDIELTQLEFGEA